MHAYPQHTKLTGSAFRQQSMGRIANVAYDSQRARWAELRRIAAANTAKAVYEPSSVPSRKLAVKDNNRPAITLHAWEWVNAPAVLADDPTVTVLDQFVRFVEVGNGEVEHHSVWILAWTETVRAAETVCGLLAAARIPSNLNILVRRSHVKLRKANQPAFRVGSQETETVCIHGIPGHCERVLEPEPEELSPREWDRIHRPPRTSKPRTRFGWSPYVPLSVVRKGK